MFNEAFWFFYWVGIVGALRTLASVFIAVGLVASIISFAFIDIDMYGDERKSAIRNLKRWFKRFSIAALSLGAVAFLAPTEEALYAGAGQYVAEGAELDETLLRLKKLIDKKIYELEQAE